MSEQQLHVITGAFGYSGKYIAARLLKEGHRVRTLTNSGNRANPFGGQVEAHPFNFDAPGKLVESLRGATVLYNTYRVRFDCVIVSADCSLFSLLVCGYSFIQDCSLAHFSLLVLVKNPVRSCSDDYQLTPRAGNHDVNRSVPETR